MKQLIIYDLDGTLVDTKDDIAQAVNHMRQQMQLPPLAADEICRHVGRGLQELVKRCLKIDPSTRTTPPWRGGLAQDSAPRAHEEIPRAMPVGLHNPKRLEEGMQRYRAYYAAHLLDQSRLYPGALELLEYFKQRTQVVITNKPNPYSRDILVGLGIADYFLEIVAGDSPYPKKPDPTSTLLMMETAHASPARTLLIGDSPIDLETGRKAGVMTVGIVQGFADPEELVQARPDVLVRNFGELLECARRWEW